jgi:alpha-tubulin suppressor-like RCC1 family protein
MRSFHMQRLRNRGVCAAILMILLGTSNDPVTAQQRSQGRVQEAQFLALAAGHNHTCGLTSDGDAYCWGRNDSGQLGIGSMDESAHPKPLLVSGKLKFELITANGNHACGLTAAGVAYCWGENKYAQLGNGTLASAAAPVPVSGNLRFKSLSAGATHTCGLTISDTAFCWGGNWHGQLGIGTMDGEDQYPCCRTSPLPVAGGLHFSSVRAAGIHTCGLTLEGEAYCWGNHKNFGQLGTGDTDLRDRPMPMQVAGKLKFISISAGIPSCGIASDGAAYCWGGGPVPELGIKSNVERLDHPAAVPGDIKFEAISSGAFYACGIAKGGRLYCWGFNRYGQIGIGSTKNVDVPQLVSKELKFKLVVTGGNEFSGHACAITTAGLSLCWGNNRWGQVGNGDTVRTAIPVPVAFETATPR